VKGDTTASLFVKRRCILQSRSHCLVQLFWGDDANLAQHAEEGIGCEAQVGRVEADPPSR
jgi:hypothetical protein